MSAPDNGEPLDPMVPLLTGWLSGYLCDQGRRDFLIRAVVPCGLSAVCVHFGSGLVLRVKVEEVRP